MLPKGKSGVPEYKHLCALEDQGQIVPELLAFRKASFPLCLKYYWDEFKELSRRRGSDNMTGTPLPVSWQDIASFAACQGKVMNTIELQLITRCDEIFLDAWRKLHPAKSDAPAAPESARR